LTRQETSRLFPDVQCVISSSLRFLKNNWRKCMNFK
jgi:hypothetical protein